MKVSKKEKPTEIRQEMDYDIEFEDSLSDKNTESLTESALNIRKNLNLQKMILAYWDNTDMGIDENFAEFKSLPDGGKDFDWNRYAEEFFGGHWPSNVSDWLENVDKIAAISVS